MGAVGTPMYNPTEWDVYITGCLDVDSDNENAQHFYTPEEMKYHTSWDWLMPVVQKCFEVAEHEDDFFAISGNLPYMDSTYKAVVEFIKDHNEQ